MNQTVDILRRCFVASLALLVLTLSMVQPVLAESDLGHQVSVEAQHDPGECPQSHDHTICTQLGANYASPSVVAIRHHHRPVTQTVAANHFVAPVLAVLHEGNPTRAPPVG